MQPVFDLASVMCAPLTGSSVSRPRPFDARYAANDARLAQQHNPAICCTNEEACYR